MAEVKQQRREPWISDQGDGNFRNPVLHADYSDPDVIRVGEDFYMTASSFGHIPGLPILHSKDLVNWTLINHVIKEMDLPGYDRPQHGNGVWAPSLRYHDGKYWIFYGDPDVGILMSTADHPAGEWTPLHLVQGGKGLIDTCPFWDEDGKAYLVHAFANSRCGIKHKLRLCAMAPDGSRLLDEGQIIYDGTDEHPTMEGPKMYKRNGYYYIFAPAGGVKPGWQTVLRSKSIYGPYEDKIVLHQGDSVVNGPHQGGWVELESGESWFMHFQDKGAYGRIVHLQPVKWEEDWPLMGADTNGDGIGEPVMHYRKPNVGHSAPIAVPVTSDEFTERELGLQWQWQANPLESWYSLGEHASHLRLYAQPVSQACQTLFDVPQLLLQKFPAEVFDVHAKLTCTGLQEGDQAGLVLFGFSFASLVVSRNMNGGLVLKYMEGDDAEETIIWTQCEMPETVWLRAAIRQGAVCSFAYSTDGQSFLKVEAAPFTARESRWVGAKAGLLALQGEKRVSGGYADFDWFRMTAPDDTNSSL
ncbi:MAG: glycoside hydrolase 43 family protein [Candidatus Pristimantibacillus sp.]